MWLMLRFDVSLLVRCVCCVVRVCVFVVLLLRDVSGVVVCLFVGCNICVDCWLFF